MDSNFNKFVGANVVNYIKGGKETEAYEKILADK